MVVKGRFSLYVLFWAVLGGAEHIYIYIYIDVGCNGIYVHMNE